MAREPAEAGEKSVRILGRKHADNEHKRPGRALLQFRDRARNGDGAADIVAAVEPKLGSRRQAADKPARRKTLHARGPFDLAHSPLISLRGYFGCLDRPQRRDRNPGIFDLMAAEQARARQIEKARLIRINEPALLFMRAPRFAGNEKLARE